MNKVARRKVVAAAEQLITQISIDELPVDVFTIAERLNITVQEKPASTSGVSGALIKVGNNFAITYSTHISSTGFQRFSVAHELGHMHIPGHAEALFPLGEIEHESQAGYRSTNHLEREADEFAANLLMPRKLFEAAMRGAGDGLSAIIELADHGQTSRIATAIRYANLAPEAMAIVVSKGQTLCYAFLSDELKEFQGLTWPTRNSSLPHVPTATFNQNTSNVGDRKQEEHETPLAHWFGGNSQATVREEIIGLGQYGRTLTVLTCELLPDEDEEERERVESWELKIH